MNDTEAKRPWYLEPMVWMVVAIPAIAVVMGVVLLVISVTNHDGLVVDDYYKRGLQINETLAREARASELGLKADIDVQQSGNRLSMTLSGSAAFEAPQQVKLGFYHATRQDRDQVLSMRRDASGTYTAPLPELSEGRWYVSAETPEWRLTRVVFFPAGRGFSIAPADPAAGGRS